MDNMSDSMKKVHIADFIFSININPEERGENRARIFTTKARRGPQEVEVPISTAYERMAFFAPAALNDPVPSEVDTGVMRRRRPARPANMRAPGLPEEDNA